MNKNVGRNLSKKHGTYLAFFQLKGNIEYLGDYPLFFFFFGKRPNWKLQVLIVQKVCLTKLIQKTFV